MSVIIGLICAAFIWVFLFKPFFSDRKGFLRSAKCACRQGYAHMLNNEEEAGSSMKLAMKFYSWLFLGGSGGYLVNFLVKSFI